MKKIAILLSVLMLLPALAVSSVGGSDYIIENDPVVAFKATPVIDGEIEPYEGWSSPADFNNDTVAHFWRFLALTTEAKLYFAYSEEGLYFAAKITEHDSVNALNQNGVMSLYEGNGFVYSTDFDYYTDGERISGYGWDGDVMTLMVDPGRIVYYNSRYYNANTVWYNIGLFQDKNGNEYPRVYRSQASPGEITGFVECAGHRVGNGWTFEAMIPWEIIAEDVNMLSTRMSYDITAEDLYKGSYLIYAAAMYMDRFYDKELDSVETWGRYVTVCERCPDGYPGWSTSGPVAKSLGLTMVLGDEPAFSDIPNESWYTDAVYLCYYNGYMSGMGEGRFAPARTLRRSEFVTLLAAFAEADVSSFGGLSFKDVAPGKWYTKTVQWAYENGYVSGMGNGVFSPDRGVTREQLAQMLYSYAEKNGWDVSAEADLSEYKDEGTVSNWARTALGWAIANGLISGTSGELLSPKSTATRAQAALILVKFARAYGIELMIPNYNV